LSKYFYQTIPTFLYVRTVTYILIIFHLLFSKIRRILPGWKKWTYCNGLRESDELVWFTVRNIFLSKHNHELLSYLVCGLHHFDDFEEFGIALRNNSFWESIESASTTVITRISITIFHSVVSRILHGSVFQKNTLVYLRYIKPE